MARKNIVKGKIANGLESVAPDHILGVSNDIFDECLQMYQGDINRSSLVFDISVHKAVDGVPTAFADLGAALGADGENVPKEVRQPGMRVQFIQVNVQSFDHKYVQYRYMETDATTDDTFANVANWQGVDSEPTDSSKNLVESGGVYKSIKSLALKTDRIKLNSTNVPLVTEGEGQNIFTGFVTSGGTVGSTGNYIKVDVSNYNFVRFLGIEYESGHNVQRGYAFYDSSDVLISGSAKPYDAGTGNAIVAKEYFIPVPEGTTYFKTNVVIPATDSIVNLSNFYCFIYDGDDVKSYVEKEIADAPYVPTNNVVNDLTTGGVNKVLSAEQGKILNEKDAKLEEGIYEADNLGSSEIYSFYINSDGIYNSREGGIVVIPVKAGDKFVIRGHNSRNGYIGMLNSISNMSADVAADFMEGCGVVTLEGAKYVSVIAPANGFLFLDLYNGYNPCAPQSIKKYVLVNKNVSVDNMVYRKLVCSGKATTSTTSTTNIITDSQPYFTGLLNAPVKTGTKMVFTIEGLSAETVSKVYYYINGGSRTLLSTSNGEVVVTAPVDVESIKVATLAADVVSPSEVSVKCEIDDVGYIFENLDEQIRNVHLKSNELISDVSIINSFSEGGADKISSSDSIAELANQVYQKFENISVTGGTLYNFSVKTDGTYEASSAYTMMVFAVQRGDIIEVTAPSNKKCYVGLLRSLSNMTDGGTVDFMPRTSLITVNQGTVLKVCALENGYFFYNRYYPNHGNTATPSSLVRFRSIKFGIGSENLKYFDTIISGSATPSSSAASVNIIPASDISISANKEFHIDVTGVGIYTSEWGYLLNDGAAATYVTESSVILKFDYAITRIRILMKKAAFISDAGEVTAVVYTNNIGNTIKELESEVAELESEVAELKDNANISISIDDLKKAANVQTNVFTESFSLTFKNGGMRNSNSIFSCVAKYIQANGVTDVPTIKIYDSNLASNRRQNYIIGGKDAYECKQWRYPMMINSNDTVTIAFTIPSGVTLTVNSFNVSFDGAINRDTMKLYEHNGYWGTAFNARLAFQQAAVCGYYGAIAVPKLTTDGTFVCYHDDEPLATNNDLQMVGGESLTQELGALKMNQLTFAQTQMLEYKNTNILGEHSRIPTLDEFFEICAKTGVHPCLSCHPTYTVAQWALIKNLAEKYNVLDKLTIKHANSANEAADVFSAFGDTIEMYMWDINVKKDQYGQIIPINDRIAGLISDMQGTPWNGAKAKVGFEFMRSDMAVELTDANKAAMTSAGYVWGVGENTPDITVFNQLNEAGCYEWTIGAFFSNGLNW